ncbi:class III lanthionine synthetase LanKC, partial [Streptomyces clavuligerus]
RTPLPEGWQTARSGDWFACHPTGLTLPPQGWKIHVAAALDNAESILQRVAEYCLPRRISFKFIPSRQLLLQRNGKYADRGGSGKFITVYPPSEDAFPGITADLMALLDGEHGPYILSDLRCGDGPVHVRYGAFTGRRCVGPEGRLVPAISDPSGTLVPDPRGPVLRIPEWVTPPAFLTPHLDARNAVGTGELPYEIKSALHFSNGGGVYKALSTRTGETVVLKEGRPHAGLAMDGADAVTRLERERTALERLAGLDCVPRVLGAHTVGDHRFLALEHISGTPLNTLLARRFPLGSADVDPEAITEHTAWSHRIHGLVESAVAQVHARGLVFGDLHMANIMVDEDETRVVLLDFEAACPAEERRPQVVANPAFIAPRGRTGTDVDRYALACLRLALFLPLTTLFMIDRTLVERMAEDITRIFPVTLDELRPAVEEILRDPEDTTPHDAEHPVAHGAKEPVPADPEHTLQDAADEEPSARRAGPPTRSRPRTPAAA